MESMRGMMSPVEGCTDIWGCKINLIISKYVLNSTVYREVKTEWWKTSCGVLLSEQFVKEAALQEKWAGFSLIKTRGMKIILVRFIRKTLLIFKMKSVLLHDRKFWEWVFTGFFFIWRQLKFHFNGCTAISCKCIMNTSKVLPILSLIILQLSKECYLCINTKQRVFMEEKGWIFKTLKRFFKLLRIDKLFILSLLSSWRYKDPKRKKKKKKNPDHS